jgi:hypothetical protein
MDYLETDAWWYLKGRTTLRRKEGNLFKVRERKTRGVRFCGCGERLSIYNPESSCFQCQEKATRRKK